MGGRAWHPAQRAGSDERARRRKKVNHVARSGYLRRSVTPLRPSSPIRLLPLTVALATAACASLAGAQAPTGAAGEPDTSYIAGVEDLPAVGLTLDQARRLATDHAPVSRAARGGLQMARGARMREAGAFDPVLFGEGSRTSAESPVT